VAQTGYNFLQWNDGITANPRSIPMTQDSTFTAIFVVNNSYITVHANDSTMGSVSGTGLYGYNAPVTLIATPYSGYHFLRWSDGNTQNPRYLAAVRDSSFTAIFVSNVSTITVSNANPDTDTISTTGGAQMATGNKRTKSGITNITKSKRCGQLQSVRN
jgi:hypothetical protein